MKLNLRARIIEDVYHPVPRWHVYAMYTMGFTLGAIGAYLSKGKRAEV